MSEMPLIDSSPADIGRLRHVLRFFQRALLLRSIGGRFALLTLVFSLALALGVTALRVDSESQAEQARLVEGLRLIQDSYAAALAEQLWDMDTDALRLQLQGLLNVPDMRHARVLDSDGTVLASVGVIPTQGVLEHRFELTRADGPDSAALGQVVLVASQAGALQRVQAQRWTWLANALVTFLLIWVFVLVLFQWQVGRHLQHIATSVTRSRNPLGQGRLSLRRGPRLLRSRDELDQMVDALNGAGDRLRALLGELIESRRRYSDIVDNVELMAVTLDMTGRITYCNDHLLRVTGWSRDELLGRNWFESFAPGPQTEVAEVFQAVIHDEPQARHFQNNIRTRSGQTLTVRFTNSVLRDTDGQPIGTASIGEDITQRLASETQLQANEALLQAIVDTVSDGVISIDEAGHIRTFNLAAARIFGYSADEVVGHNVSLLMPDPYRSEHDSYLHHFIATGEARVIGPGREVVGRRKDGSTFPMELAVREMVVNGQRGFTGSVRDVSERHRAETQMRMANLIFQSSPEAMLVVDLDNNILSVNPALTQITGYELEDILRGGQLRQLRSRRHGDDFYRRLREQLADTGQWQGELWVGRKDGEDIVCSVTMRTVRDMQGQAQSRVVLFNDITALKTSQELIWRQANFDPLTGLVNRTMFLERLAQDLRECDGAGHRLGLLVIDLDRFKEINETQGHSIGDVLLKEVARRLLSVVRDGDTLARIGGDEFALILPRTHDTLQIEALATDLQRAFASPFVLGADTAYVSACVGISVHPDDGASAEVLLKQADQAVHAAKVLGQGRWQFFTAAMQEAALSRARVARDLRRALERGELQLHYQPIVDLPTGRINKAEALLRWQHPGRGMVNPATFIPVAEETGLMPAIGDWVFETTAAQAARWRQTLDPGFCISLNTSPVQFRQEPMAMAERWLAHLESHGMVGDSVVIEITEGVLMDASSRTHDLLASFGAAGIGIALDDFGTGYSSLAYLQRYPVHFLKIDQAFVRPLQPGSRDLALCEAIIAMAHKLGLRVVAEGIETEQQAALLRAAGCDFGQGFLYAPALPADAFERLMRTGAAVA